MAEPLFDQLQRLQQEFRGHPPVERWHPELSGDMDLRICRDGRWVHEGTEIQRQSLVRLFASILKREGDEYFLVTPVEKWRIQVEDVPFIATQVAIGRERNRELLLFTTNTGDVVPLDHGHPFQLNPFGEPPQPVPYIEVRDGLQARLSRDVYYQLVEWAEDVPVEEKNTDGQLWIRSAGARFLLGKY
ncbi:DUF1285 domain-containing protein [Microbulbifer rhizosphaerae]|uniref:DUF1285 domain-containing protein n=1 Tax=Microbulbifer rhizosphaerae TaxID=1562603 RepID=A0A7W4Z976_9GAMM|nr:DUF1285 domain-containing protein [Microbulbifer rhizosphaerae]MBB3061362.1 hypothetical protein [Microbulbifer rhizosphaerae]